MTDLRKENAPWPGFEPGSGGLAASGNIAKVRQPPILDRTILPGHPIS